MSPCVSIVSCVSLACSISATAGPSVLQPGTSCWNSGRQQASQWSGPLQKLRDERPVTFGTPQELSEYQNFAVSCIEKAQALVQADSLWNECNQVIANLDRALSLCKAGRSAQGRALAVELIGFAQLQSRLAEQLSCARLPPNANPPGSGGCDSISSSTSTSSSTSSGLFKVPALPLKRQRSPTSEELQQQQLQAQPYPEPEQRRRHSAPKRRATPQVWAGGPICITPAAPPNSGMHGETVCDETLLAYWCPISDQRLKTDPQPGSPPAVDSPESPVGGQKQEQQQAVPQGGVQSWSVGTSPQQQPQQPAAPRPSSTSTRSSSLMLQGSPAVTAGLPPSRAGAVSTARSDAIEALKRSMHEDPASKPSADTLLFDKSKQLPIVNWSGPIKHRANGRVVEVCSLSLQVPGAFLEEFPATLFAAEIRHRKSVSLGRHVVCRANLQPLSEHQLAGLAAMARAQLVCLCMLQTAELHLVPYFDNKNHVRCVGFLKIKAT